MYREEERRRLVSNIWKIQLNTFLMNFFVYSPILFISFQEKGISFVGISTILAIASVANLLFEIPTGIMADRWGRKYMLMLAAIAGVASMLLWSSSVYLALVIGMLFRSLVNNAVNGSDTALLYDTLVELDRKGEYARHNGTRYSMAMLGFAIAAALASLIPKIGTYTAHFLLTAVAFAAALLIAATLHETRHHKSADSALLHLRDAYRHTRKHRELYKIILYIVTLGASLMIILTYFQFFLKEAGIDPQRFGFIYAGLALIAAAISHYSDAIEKRLGEWTLLALLPLLLIAGILLIAIVDGVVTTLLGLVLIEVVLGLQGSVLNEYLQRHSASAQRSTIESLKSFYQSCYQIVLYLIGGFIAETVGIGAAAIFVVAVMAFIIIPPLYFLRKESSESAL